MGCSAVSVGAAATDFCRRYLCSGHVAALVITWNHGFASLVDSPEKKEHNELIFEKR